MKKYKHFLSFSLLILLLEISGILIITAPGLWTPTIYYFYRVSAILLALWGCGVIYLCIRKGNLKKTLSRLLMISNCILGTVVLAFFCICLLARCHPYQGSFSASTSLFDDKNVMIIVPHQDDDINIAGGLVEQYTGRGSEVTVVFTTNGDRFIDSDIRAVEAVQVLTALGVKKENVYFLGFGDQWVPQSNDGTEIVHIYNSSDPDAVWTSLHGATATYGAEHFDSYLQLPYTRNNYLYSIQSIIQEKMPDTIMAVDFDSHIDHRAADLLFEEALCNILTLHPDYHPTVYKGFCYETGWTAVDDYFSNPNLLSTQHPDESVWAYTAYGYSWDERLRFPMSHTNLNWVLSNNSVYHSLNGYASQTAYTQAGRILNGDKVFWERRTDSLLYNAQFFADGEQTQLLNNFKLKEFDSIKEDDCVNSGFVSLYGKTVSIQLENAIAVNSLCLYDNPDPTANILAGYIDFSDGSRISFSELHKNGSGTVLAFPEKQISWMEIVITEAEGETAGLSEVEAYFDLYTPQANPDSYLMALDSDGNFVYDYLLHGTDSVELTIGRFPTSTPLTEEDISLSWDASSKNTSCYWENDTLIVTCQKGSECVITVSDGVTSTTFTVSNPSSLKMAYLQALRFTEKSNFNIRALYEVSKLALDYYMDMLFPKQ